MAVDRIKDKMWIRQSFMLPQGALDDAIMRRRLMSTASFKFVDTTLGGNFAINAPPSYSRFADPRMGGRLGESSGTAEVGFMNSTGRFQVSTPENNESYEDEINHQMTYPRSSGMGAYYSEAIDDNNQIVVMRFGVPAFNTMSNFFTEFYDSKTSMFARNARADEAGVLSRLVVGAADAAGSALGTMLSLAMRPLQFVSTIVRFLAGVPASKYYYFKPSMFPYWAAVQNIVNSIGVNIGIVPEAYTKSQENIYGADAGNFGPNDYAAYHKAMPDIISPSGFIDVFAMGTKAQRRANAFNSLLTDRMENNITNLTDLARALQSTRDDFSQLREFKSGGEISFWSQYIEAFKGSKLYRIDAETSNLESDKPVGSANAGATTAANGETTGGEPGGSEAPAESTDVSGAVSPAPDAAPGSILASLFGSNPGSEADNSSEIVGDRTDYDYKSAGGTSTLWGMLKGELRDGANFVSFKVDYSGPVSESFSNEVGESGIAQQANSMSASARSKRFDWADGNITSGLGDIFNAVTGFLNNTIDAVHMSGLAALAGSAFVDIPQVWQNATSQMPSASFTIQLRSPYANRLSQMQNLYIPLAMLLAAGLPKMTGKHSYTEPFLVQLFCKGRVNIRMGIVDSISISRGEGNVGWNQDGRALGIDINFSVKDLSTIMMMPLVNQYTPSERFLGLLGKLVGVSEGATAAVMASTYDDDNVFTDYMAALGGLGFQEQIYVGRKWRLNRIRYQRAVEGLRSPAMWMSNFVNCTTVGRLWNAISQDTDRPAKGY